MYYIADLNVAIPDVGDMPDRMKHYEVSSECAADISIGKEELRPGRWRADDILMQYYMETGWIFYKKLLDFNGMMLHASAVAINGYGYLFSGPCGMGKSTHARLYLREYGECAKIINDDKPAVRHVGSTWFTYGTPWCGKDGLNTNTRVKLGGICFLRRGETKISRLSSKEAVHYILAQTQHKLDREAAIKLLAIVDRLATEVPVFELFSHADLSDARLSYAEMTNAIMEAGI